MEHRILGRTGLEVSVLGFGGAPVGLQGYLGADDLDSAAFRRQAAEALRVAVERGINYFDTAPGYGDGRSERIFGEALEPFRDRIVLATKYALGDPDGPVDARSEGLRESLERLRTDRVDVLQMHGGFWTDEQAEAILTGPVLDWADDMRRRGRVRFTGITAEGPSGGLERLLRSGRFDVLQIAYNLIYQDPCDYQREPRGVIPPARSLGMGVTTMRTATSGFLQKLFAEAFPEIDAARVTRAAIQFVLSTPEVDCALVGMRSVAEVMENAALAADASARFDLRALHRRYD